MSGAELMDVRADVAVLLRAWGWNDELDGCVLERHGAQWAVTSAGGDCQVAAAGAAFTVPFTADVPAPVIALACRATAGDPPAAPDLRTAALADRTHDGLEAGEDYNNAVFNVVRALAALAGPDTGTTPIRWGFTCIYGSGELFVRDADVLAAVRSMADCHWAGGHGLGADALMEAADQMAAVLARSHAKHAREGW